MDWLVNNYTAKIRLFWKKQEKMRFFFHLNAIFFGVLSMTATLSYCKFIVYGQQKSGSDGFCGLWTL